MKRTLLTCAASLLFVLMMGGVYAWAHGYLLTMRAEVFAREEGAGTRKLQESLSDSARQMFASTALERQALERYFVHQEEVASVVSRLERLGGESGVQAEVSGIGIESETSPESERKKVRSVDITIQGTGSRAAAEDFLKRVELFPHVLSVKEVSLEKLVDAEGRGERWRLAASIRIGVIHQ